MHFLHGSFVHIPCVIKTLSTTNRNDEGDSNKLCTYLTPKTVITSTISNSTVWWQHKQKQSTHSFERATETAITLSSFSAYSHSAGKPQIQSTCTQFFHSHYPPWAVHLGRTGPPMRGGRIPMGTIMWGPIGGPIPGRIPAQNKTATWTPAYFDWQQWTAKCFHSKTLQHFQFTVLTRKQASRAGADLQSKMDWSCTWLGFCCCTYIHLQSRPDFSRAAISTNLVPPRVLTLPEWHTM